MIVTDSAFQTAFGALPEGAARAYPSIMGISLDLDDTLWPAMPTLLRAHEALIRWLLPVAPKAARLCDSRDASRAVRKALMAKHPHLAHDMSWLRRESIRQHLLQAGEDPNLAHGAFDVFYAERQIVTLYDDVAPALQWLAARYPLVAVTNGNADVRSTGLGAFFSHAISARTAGAAKPDVRIYLRAARELDIAPTAMLHIGDDPLMDGVGAMRAGFGFAWVNRSSARWPRHARMENAQPDVVVTDLLQLCHWLESGVSPAEG